MGIGRTDVSELLRVDCYQHIDSLAHLRFGISRAMVDLVARVVTLDSRKRRLGIVMSGHPEEMVEIGQHFVRESHCLLLEADIWGNSLSALPQHSRVTVSPAC